MRPRPDLRPAAARRATGPRARLVGLLVLVTAASVGWPPPGAQPRSTVYRMVFPVDGEHRFSRDFGDPRGRSRSHEGTDILAEKMTPVVAVADGTVRWMADERGGDCCAVFIVHDDGWRSRYIHLNNDTPGTDDGRAYGIARGLRRGSRVRAGQLVGWVGDSGNAEGTGSHLHFELRRPDGTPVDPFPSLQAALGNPFTAGTPRIAGPAIRPPEDLMRPEVRRPRAASPVEPRAERRAAPTLPEAPEAGEPADTAAEDELAADLGEPAMELAAPADPVTPFLPVPGDDCSAGYSPVEEIALAEVREPARPTFSCFSSRSSNRASTAGSSR